MQAIIVAGGKGTRMAPFTNDRPKSMVGILDKPLIGYQVEALKDAGVKRIVIEGEAANHAAEMKRYLGDGSNFGVSIFHRVPEGSLGTAGSIRDGMQFLGRGNDKPTIVTYGDVFSDIEIEKVYERHTKGRNPVTAVTVSERLPYGVFSRIKGGTSFVEKPKVESSAGMFVISKSLVGRLPEVGDFSNFLLNALKDKRIAVGLYEHTGFRVNVNSLADVNRVEGWLLKERGVELSHEDELYLRAASDPSRK